MLTVQLYIYEFVFLLCYCKTYILFSIHNHHPYKLETHSHFEQSTAHNSSWQQTGIFQPFQTDIYSDKADINVVH